MQIADLLKKIRRVRLDLILWGLLFPGVLTAAKLFRIFAGKKPHEINTPVLLVCSVICAATIYGIISWFAICVL